MNWVLFYWIGAALSLLFAIGYIASTNDDEGWTEDSAAMGPVVLGVVFYGLLWPASIPVTIAWTIGKKARKK